MPRACCPAWLRAFCAALCLALLILSALPAPACADGGLVLDSPELWAMIDEGQQIAVVRLVDRETAQVDLFISMADRSGQSHEVTFFVPLGVRAGDFNVAEERSLDFDTALTEEIEDTLTAQVRHDATYKSTIAALLLPGTLVTNGVWSWVVLAPLLLSGCAAAPEPVATFETPGSQVAIYDLDPATDLQALIATTGLAPQVQQTLARLRGQQIAVVKLRTQPAAGREDGGTPSERTGQPGIHLTWKSGLVSQGNDAAYTYPLGTGKAWASPIELTRIYVTAPPELNFRVDAPRGGQEHPELGTDLSGMSGGLAQRMAWRIHSAENPAFALDEAYGAFGHIVRATYIKSNAAQDLVVTRLAAPDPAARAALRQTQQRDIFLKITWLLGLPAGIGAWLAAWRLVLPWRLGVRYRWREKRLYTDAFKWMLIYGAVVPAALFVEGILLVGAAAVYSAIESAFAGRGAPAALVPLAFLVGLPLLVTLLGAVNAFFYARSEAARLEVTRGRAFGAYLLVVLAANVAYGVFAAAYLVVAGAV